MGRTVQVLTILAVLSACTGGESSQTQVTRTDSAGLEIVESSGEDLLLDWTFEPVLTLGGADSGPESFYRLREETLALGNTGQIFVLDPGNLRIHVFDPEGTHLTTFGGEGQGPGEFQYPGSLVLSETGDLVVFDVRRRSILSFNEHGAFSGEVQGPRSFLGGTARVFGDSLLFWRRTRNRETQAREFHLTVATPRDTSDLVSAPLPSATSLLYEECGISITLPPLFANPPKWDSSNRITVLSEPPDYSIRVFLGGQETMRIRRTLDPEEATVDRAVEYLGEGEKWTIGGTEECTVPPSTVIEKRGVATHIPLIDDVAVSPDGWIWVRRVVVGDDGGPIDLFDPTGAYQGTLPGATPWPASFGDEHTLLSLEEDDLDVQRIVLYRIQRK